MSEGQGFHPAKTSVIGCKDSVLSVDPERRVSETCMGISASCDSVATRTASSNSTSTPNTSLTFLLSGAKRAKMFCNRSAMRFYTCAKTTYDVCARKRRLSKGLDHGLPYGFLSTVTQSLLGPPCVFLYLLLVCWSAVPFSLTPNLAPTYHTR